MPILENIFFQISKAVEKMAALGVP